MKVKNINDLCNEMSMRDSLHTQFGNFSIAFKPTVSSTIRSTYIGIQVH